MYTFIFEENIVTITWRFVSELFRGVFIISSKFSLYRSYGSFLGLNNIQIILSFTKVVVIILLDLPTNL